jgi:SAM-dependent methyltransferase
VGVEISGAKIAQFAAAHPDDHRVMPGDIEALPASDSWFDVALVNEVLEHVPNDSRAMSEIRRVLKPGGSVIVFSPNRLYPFETHGVNLQRSRRRVAHYVPFIPYIPLPIGRAFFEYWARNYWPRQLRRLVTDAGFKIQFHGFIWQTFENISGNQPLIIRLGRPLLRRLAEILERTPGLRALGTSQVIIAQRV